jgi:hypothetical protein
MSKKLIITTGDISDADGFLALAEYSLNTNADILFIMNYPAFLRFNIEAENTETDYYKGFNYGLGKFLEKMKNDDTEYYNLLFLDDVSNNTNKKYFIYWLSKITAYFCLKIFTEIKEKATPENKKGNLYFMIGGINKYNPFNHTIIKNEFMVYKELILSSDNAKINDEIKKILGGLIIDDIKNISLLESLSQSIIINNNKYTYDLISNNIKNINVVIEYNEIYIDGNGSISFYNNKNNNKLFSDTLTSSEINKIKGFYVMGGVLGDVEPYTASIIPTVIHRPSLATMNQYYSPEEFYNFINFLFSNENNENKKLIFVSNNSIFADDNLISNLNYLLIKSILLNSLCNCYYDKSKGVKKPFDLMTAKILIRDLHNDISLTTEITQENISSLIYSREYGITLLYSKKIKSSKLLSSAFYNKDPINQLKSLPAFDVEKSVITDFSKIANINENEITRYKAFKARETELLITSQLLDTVIFNCYIATLDNPPPNYKQGINGKYTYGENTKVIIKSYDDIIRSYGKEPTYLLSELRGGSFKRKIRKLKSYIKSKNRIFKS